MRQSVRKKLTLLSGSTDTRSDFIQSFHDGFVVFVELVKGCTGSCSLFILLVPPTTHDAPRREGQTELFGHGDDVSFEIAFFKVPFALVDHERGEVVGLGVGVCC